MPVESTSALNIVCDNAACPGNSLDPADRMGWLFISSEVYGQPTVQHVYCSAGCAATVGAAVEVAQAEFEATRAAQPGPMQPIPVEAAPPE